MSVLKRLRREHGQSLVIVAVAMIGLLAFAGLALDGGFIFVQRRNMQNAADAAALAGAREIFVTSNVRHSDVWQRVNEYCVQRNGASSFTATFWPGGEALNQSSGLIPTGATGTCVTATVNYNTFFLGLVGWPRMQMSADACAEGSPGGCGGQYVIWANSQTCSKAIDWSGGKWNVTGIVHSNNTVVNSGTGNVINGSVEYVTSIDAKFIYNPPAPANPVRVSAGGFPVNFNLADYQPGGRAARAAGSNYRSYSSSVNFSTLPGDGLYYVNGDVGISDGSVNNRVTIVATGKITWSGSNGTVAPYMDDLWLYSTASQNCNSGGYSINLSGGGSSWAGVLFAPNGGIQVSGTNNATTFSGSIVANSVHISGASGRMQYAGTCTGGAGTVRFVR